MKELLKLKEILPKDPETLNNLGVVYYHHGLYKEALKLFKMAWYYSGYKLNIAKNNLETLARRLNINPADITIDEKKDVNDLKTIETLIFMGQEEKAEILLKEYIESNPNMLDALRMAAALSKNLGKYEDTVEYTKKILSIRPDDVDAKKLLAEALYNLGKLEESLSILKNIVKEHEDAEAYFLMSFVYGEMGDYENAELAMLKAQEINPSLSGGENILSLYTNTPKAPKQVKQGTESGIVLAKAYLNKGLIEEASRELRRVKIGTLTLKARKDYDFIKSVLAIIKGEYEEALQICESYKASIRREPDMLKLGAVANFQLGNISEAVDLLREANNGKVDEFMWLIYQLKRKAVEIPEPDKNFAHIYNSAVFMLNEGRFDEVLRVLNDNRPYSKILRARAYVGKGEYERGLKEIEGVQNFDADIIRAFVLFKLQRYDEVMNLSNTLKPTSKELKSETFLVNIPNLSYPLPILVEFPYERFYGSSLYGIKKAFSYGNIKAVLKVIDLSMRFGKTPEHIKYLSIVSFLIGKISLAEYLLGNLKGKGIIDLESLEILGIIEEWKGNGRVALSIFGELLKKGKKEAAMHILRILVKMNLYEMAYNFYNKNKFPEHPEIMFWLGEVMLGLGNLSEAERIGKELIKMGDERGYLLLGESLFKKEDYHGALENLIKVKGGYAEQKAHFLVGNIYALMGNNEEAIKHWEKAVKLNYDKSISSRASRNLQGLKNFFLNLKK
ncbi:MAG: tetratricopeptide repeat protein [candidate division WOR-3 bacterium]